MIFSAFGTNFSNQGIGLLNFQAKESGWKLRRPKLKTKNMHLFILIRFFGSGGFAIYFVELIYFNVNIYMGQYVKGKWRLVSYIHLLHMQLYLLSCCFPRVTRLKSSGLNL